MMVLMAMSCTSSRDSTLPQDSLATLDNNSKYKLLCPRGTQTCALAVAVAVAVSVVNGNGKVILDTHPESDQHQN